MSPSHLGAMGRPGLAEARLGFSPVHRRRGGGRKETTGASSLARGPRGPRGASSRP
uniref:Uncharacterized protein n=1 Tax=Leersia perrieri TaxID=77586 RepID=A0A0D9XQX1_9ORYZ